MVLQSALSPRMPIVLQDEGYIRFRKGLGNYFLAEFAQKTKVALKKHTECTLILVLQIHLLHSYEEHFRLVDD